MAQFKDRTKRANNFVRKAAKRDTYDRVLIVCEGEKTEPNYLKELIAHFKLNTANVEIDGTSGSSPKSVFKHAKQKYLEEKKLGEKFDRVYCVFDKDGHASYDETLMQIRQKTPINTYFVTNSVPCFEYWLLLHFTYTTQPFAVTGNKSRCDCVLTKLKEHISHYDKGDKGIFSQVMQKTDDAIKNSKRAITAAEQNDTDNPSTNMHELVVYLQDLKK